MAYESVLVNFMNIRRQDMMVKKYSTSATILLLYLLCGRANCLCIGYV